MNVLVIHGSMRKNGNTKILSEEFVRGAKEAGHKAEIVELQGLFQQRRQVRTTG